MAFYTDSQFKENLYCPICHDIFKDPVILICSHSFCKACWQRWKTEKGTLECAVCRKKSLSYDPPRNLALKNLCEAFSLERTQRLSTAPSALCSLHFETLKLFCFDHQQPVCVICLHSETHRNHSIRPIDEAARDYKEVLRELLKPWQEKLELFKDVKGNFDQTSKDIELQAQDTERQIKDIFLMLQKILQKDEQARLCLVREEKNQKIQTMRRRSEALPREITILSDTVRATEEVLRAEDLSFLQRYKTAVEKVQQTLPADPQPTPGGLIDMAKHLNNLSIKILDSMKNEVTSTLNPRTADPAVCSTSQSEAVSWRPLALSQRRAFNRYSIALNDEPTYSPIIPPSTERIHQPPVWASAGIQRLNRTVITERKKDKRYMSTSRLDMW